MRGVRVQPCIQKRAFWGHPTDPMEGVFKFTAPRRFLKPLRVSGTGTQILHDPFCE